MQGINKCELGSFCRVAKGNYGSTIEKSVHMQIGHINPLIVDHHS